MMRLGTTLAAALALAPAVLSANDSAYTRLAGDGAHCTTPEERPNAAGCFPERSARYAPLRSPLVTAHCTSTAFGTLRLPSASSSLTASTRWSMPF